MLDLRITGGSLVDGTGAPARRADVGVAGGRIVAVGEVDEPARREVDATDLVVAPGFVDLHTHYDAQLSWDAWATPSPLHGVTTIVGGNCGFTVAPLDGEDDDFLLELLARVEGIPRQALLAGVPRTWRTYGEWLDQMEGRLGLNAGFLAGHTSVRRAVMGEAASTDRATPAQVAAMAALLHEAMAAGALGFSTSQTVAHNDQFGRPVPSRVAPAEELVALAATVADHPGTTLEIVLTGCLSRFSDEDVALMAAMSAAGRRPINWNVLTVSSQRPGVHDHQMGASDRAEELGGSIRALVLPHILHMWLTFATGFVLDSLPGWAWLFELPHDEQLAALGDPAVRARLAEGAASPEAGVLRDLSDWGAWRVAETSAPANAAHQGRLVGEIAAQEGRDPFDVLLDIAVADDLQTGFQPPAPGGDDDEGWALRAATWTDPRTVVGGSDAGAHLDMMCGAIYSTQMLAEGVRQRGLISLEEAVRQLTDVPARFYGLVDRGRVAPGAWADLCLLDPATVGPTEVHRRYDLPTGAPRLYAEATGIEHVLVNGVGIVEGGQLTGELPGTLLRSGRDTTTVLAPLGRPG